MASRKSARSKNRTPTDPQAPRSDEERRPQTGVRRAGTNGRLEAVTPRRTGGKLSPKGGVKKGPSARRPAPVLKLVTEKVLVHATIVQILEEWLALAKAGKVSELALAGSLDGNVTVEWEGGDRFLLLGGLELCKARILSEIAEEDEEDDDY